MTRDDIVQMAHLAGLVMPTGGATENQWKALEIFAELVTEKERNRIWTQDHWTEYEHKIAAEEREECAKVCEELEGLFFDLHEVSFSNPQFNTVAVRKIIRDTALVAVDDCIDAIRARGQQ